MGIINAVLRFGLDETTDLKSLFTTGLVVILVGEGVLALCYPLLQSIGLLSDYVLLLLLYVLMANLHSVFGAMAQAMGKVRLYAGSGILCTALVVALNILLLSVFRLGIVGYVLSNVIADGVVALVLFGALGLWRYFQPAAVGRGLVKQMFRYCLPLIPATVCSWIINISDRYFISFLIGPDVSGLYAVGNKVASILLILSGIFTSAWQLSIVSERSKAEQERFFSNVFSVYEAGALVGASLLMAASRLVMRFLAAPDYFSAWHYAPVLILGTAMGLGSFFASVYVAEKRSPPPWCHPGRGGGEPGGQRPADPPLRRHGGGGGHLAELPGDPHRPGGPLPQPAAGGVEGAPVRPGHGDPPAPVRAGGVGKHGPGPGLLPGDPGALLPPPVAGLEDRDLHPAVKRWHVKNPTEASQSGSPRGVSLIA